MHRQKEKTAALLVDIGNTSTVIAVPERDGFRIRRILTGKTDAQSIRKSLQSLMKGRASPAVAVISSVVPRLRRLWSSALKKAGCRKVLFVGWKTRLGINIDYPDPATIGADRLVNAAAAFAIIGGPVIAIDIGTATTFDCVTAGGRFIGGVIAPGPRMFTEFMHEKTALLPRIGLSGSIDKVGRNTVSAMRIGAKIGIAGMIREIAASLRRSPQLRNAKICVTGGYAREALKGSGLGFRVIPDLTLRGLKLVADLTEGRN